MREAAGCVEDGGEEEEVVVELGMEVGEGWGSGFNVNAAPQ